jgi:hypothetical protein
MAENVKQPIPEKPQKEDKLRSLLIKLATDPNELGRFIKDPDATMNGAGLNTADQALLKSGNQAAIHSRLTGQLAASPALLLVVDMSPDGTPSIRPTYQTPSPAWQLHGPVYAAPAWQMHGPVYAAPAWQMHGPVYAAPAWQMHGPVYAAPAYFQQQQMGYPQPSSPVFYRQPWAPYYELIGPIKVAAVHLPGMPTPLDYQPFYYW